MQSTRNPARPPIAIWRNDCVEQMAAAFGDRSYIVIDVDSRYRFSAIHLFPSLILAARVFNQLKINFEPSKHDNRPSKSVSERVRRCVFLLKRFVRAVLDVSIVLKIRPELLITFTDNAERFHAIDQILHRMLPVITVQNGSRYYVERKVCGEGYTHFFNRPSFHSCFCSLGVIDTDMHRDYGWTIIESYPVGSISADFALRRYDNTSLVESQKENLEIFWVLNSDIFRENSVRLGFFLQSYAAQRKVKIIAGIKLQKSGIRFDRYHREVVARYGEFVSFSYNTERSENLGVALRSGVIVGSYSTLLREAFSFGKKIYPINFGPREFDCHFDSLGLNFAPSQMEFNLTLDSLLAEPQHDYLKRMKQKIAHIGVFPQDIRPIERLATVISAKLTNRTCSQS